MRSTMAIMISDKSNSGGISDNVVFIRNKVKYEQSVQKSQEMQRHHERTSDGVAYTELIQQAGEILELLADLQETNLQNETTIQHLQAALVELTHERDGEHKKSNKLMKIMARHRTEWEDEIQQERKGFADVSHKHKKEIERWKRKVQKLGKRCKHLEYELKEKEGMIKVWEIQGVRENRENRSQVSLSAIATAKLAYVVAAAMLDSTATLEEEEQNIHGPNREWLGISTGSDIVHTPNNSVDNHDLEEEDDLSIHEIRARAKKLLSGANKSEEEQSKEDGDQ